AERVLLVGHVLGMLILGEHLQRALGLGDVVRPHRHVQLGLFHIRRGDEPFAEQVLGLRKIFLLVLEGDLGHLQGRLRVLEILWMVVWPSTSQMMSMLLSAASSPSLLIFTSRSIGATL